MNFFEHQARARAQSRWLLWAFAVAVLLTVLAAVAVLAATLALGGAQSPSLADATLPHLPALAGTALAVAAVIAVGSLHRIAQLRAGGGTVAAALGGVRVPPETREPRLRRLRNVVEEIAIAAGLPVPEVYVLEQEEAINAFAAGYTPADTAVAVTRGTLEKLTRDELQGVIAHEFSHVLNGDMRLNIRLMGLLAGLTAVHRIGAEIVDRTPRGGRRGPTLAVLGFGLMLAGGVGLLFARLMKARLSRQREYLADASAVQFTRQTLGIAGALKKIAGIHAGSRLQRRQGEEVSHMLFGEGLALSRLFATHPPILDRIRRIEPRFRPEALRAEAIAWNAPGFSTEAGDEAAVRFLAPAAPQVVTPAGVVAQVARPGTDDYRTAEVLRATMPEPLRQAAQTEAPALLLALLLDAREPARLRQQTGITAVRGAAEAARVLALWQQMENLHAGLRLPLMELAFPQLRTRPAAELRAFQTLVSVLVRANGQVGAFEFVLARLLAVHLEDWLQPAARSPSGRRLAEFTDEVALLLGVMADAGSLRGDLARQAFAAGWAVLWPRTTRSPQLPADWPQQLEVALVRLDALLPLAKQLLVEALVKVLAHDGRLTIGEAELLRVTCASLHCPLPPSLSGPLP